MMSQQDDNPPDNPNKPKHPRGNPRSVEVIQKDLDVVERMLCMGKSMRKIYEALPNISHQTVDRYIKRIRAEWAERHANDREQLIQETLANYNRFIEMAEEKGDLRNAAAFSKLRQDILGLAAPTRHEVKGAVAHVHLSAVELEKLNPESAEAYERFLETLKPKTIEAEVVELKALPPAEPDDESEV